MISYDFLWLVGEFLPFDHPQMTLPPWTRHPKPGKPTGVPTEEADPKGRYEVDSTGIYPERWQCEIGETIDDDRL